MPTETKAQGHNEKFRRMIFADVYPLYLSKVEKKGKTKAELDSVIAWLTGYDAKGLKACIADRRDFNSFFGQAPRMNPNASKITGMICGYRVEEIEDELVRKVRYLDKLVDELAKGKKMESILRK